MTTRYQVRVRRTHKLLGIFDAPTPLDAYRQWVRKAHPSRRKPDCIPESIRIFED
jgi:hypothetical protein